MDKTNEIDSDKAFAIVSGERFTTDRREDLNREQLTLKVLFTKALHFRFEREYNRNTK